MVLRVWLATLLTTIVCASLLSGSDAKTPQAILTLELSQYGYTEPRSERYRLALTFLDRAVTFVGDKQLALSFFVPNPAPGLSTRTGTAGGQLLLHSVLIDLSGQLLAQNSWGNADYWNSLLPLSNGSFLIQTHDRVTLYSHSWQKILERRLDYVGDQLPRFEISPDGSALYRFQDLWDRKKRRWTTRNDLIDPETLDHRASALTTGHTAETVSDLRVIFNSSSQTSRPRFITWSPLGPNKEIDVIPSHSPTDDLISQLQCKAATLVSNSMVVITGKCSSVLLLPPTGIGTSLPRRIDFPGYEVGESVIPSADGSRFVLTLAKVAHESKRTVKLETVVYDLQKNRTVFKADVSPIPQQKLAIALSPHGNLLAVQTDHLVRIWEIVGD